ncbi:unnamed protein product [Nezara viridula]|uniref:Carboxylesterase type B domain-containing protein n=1 Tax=Nezara viridula TaxID=85310 RepID=A0A9P0HR27_NEZVI|nr:unnamed protein product [Nezara viridula]
MLAAVLCVAALGHLVLGENPQVTTSYGTMKGQVLKSRDGRDFFSFTSIPYAKPPVGERRFMISEKADNWTGILDATQPIPKCFQIISPPFGPGPSGQEDCLYLNVFTPNVSGRLPVIFNIHGGAFKVGSAAELFETSKAFVDENVVYVTPNYRIGTVGFLSLEDNVIPGNMALKDQALALEWVHQEISAFGGDPNLITVVGGSAGAVCSHLICELPRTNEPPSYDPCGSRSGECEYSRRNTHQLAHEGKPQLPSDPRRVEHGAEGPFFGPVVPNPSKGWPTAQDVELSRTLVKMWANFARNQFFYLMSSQLIPLIIQPTIHGRFDNFMIDSPNLENIWLRQSPQVTTSYGTMKGQILKSRDGRDFFSFTRIPYGKPPVGERRFMISEKAENWTGIWDATRPIPSCHQAKSLFSGSGTLGQEDCLYLNVFTPNTNSRLPVIFSIHGGGFKIGTAADFGSARYFMDEDVVFVAPNYRLGTMGFLSLDDSVIPGNMGLKDQALALEWVQKEISAFGGDPNMITVIGESAGGASSNLICEAPRTNSLIKGCVSQSGNGWTPWVFLKSGVARQMALNFAKAVGCNETGLLQCLQNKPIELVGNVSLLHDEITRITDVFPVLEPVNANGALLTSWPTNANHNFPWIVGVCQDEGMIYTLQYMFVYPSMKGLNRHPGPTYFFKFNYTRGPSVPFAHIDHPGVPHGAELAYLYEPTFTSKDWPKPEDVELSKLLVKMWVNFARNQALMFSDNAAAVLCVAALGHLVLGENPQVTTSYGTMKGQVLKSRDGRDYFSFTKIPYAKPPVGERRFVISEKADNWTGTLDATQHSPYCYQGSFYGTGFLGDEDCLYLNVFTPNVNGRYPVIVYIHGGAFQAGSADLFGSAKYFMDEEVVVVYINYRLGNLGFLSMEDNAIPGNYGIKDQALALEWVYKEISAFGGDPNLITVIGIIKGCVSQSGDGWAPWAILKRGEARKMAMNLVKAVGCDGAADILKCLQGKPIEVSKNIMTLVSPVLEPETAPGAILTSWPTKANHNYPWIVGVCQDEGLVVTGRVAHGSDLAYFFESPYGPGPTWPKPADIALSKMLIKMWVNFARNQ